MELSHAHVVVVGDGSRGLVSFVTQAWTRTFPKIHLQHVTSGTELYEWAHSLAPSDQILMGIVTAEVERIDHELQDLETHPLLVDTHWIVGTDQDEHDDVSILTSAGHLAAIMPIPCGIDIFTGQAYAILVSYLRNKGYSREEILALLGEPPREAVHGLLLPGLERCERDVVKELLDGVERVIGRRPRLIIPEGVDLTRQNTSIAAVHLVLEGQVNLRRETERGELIFHHATSGLLIGLVSLTRNEEAFFTSTTTTPATVVRLTNEQLRRVIVADPSIASTLAVLAIQSLSRRLIRAEDLHMENAVLAEDLEEERQSLEQALEALKQTRAELVERTRFAMLGELSAGIAHELNNPVTALLRGAEHLDEDLSQLLSATPVLTHAHTALERARHAAVRSTAEERELIRGLYQVTHDRALARRLVQAGVESPQEAKALLAGGGRELPLIEQGARIGAALRSVISASERVIALTRSLKGYARPDSEEMRPCDVHEGLEDALRLTQHRLHGLEIKRNYGDVPHAIGHSAKLQQVWTNFLVNAAEAIEDEREDALSQGRLPARGHDEPLLEVSTWIAGHYVAVGVTDNGPGITPEVQERMFEPHFTTKAGRVRYGLGMGMSISRSIVEDAGGHIQICSVPGKTTITVYLPRADEHATHPTHEEQS